MQEKVTEESLKELKSRKNNSETEISLENGLINIKINDEEHIGLTQQEAVQRFGNNYYIMQNLRYLFNNEEIEETIKEEQSVKKEIIEIFIKTLEQNNIFEGKLSIEEIRERLEKNIDAVYIVNEGYRDGIGGYWDTVSKNIYVLSQRNLTPEEVKQPILSKDIEKLKDIDRLGVICHEVLHSLTYGKEGNCGFRKFDKNDRIIGNAINEGMTEILTKQMVPSGYKTYESEVDTTKYLLAIFGDDMIYAYLNSDFNSILNMVTERKVPEEFMKVVTLSDYKLSRSFQLMYGQELDIKLDMAKAELINYIGEIDISKFIEQNIPIPEGIKTDIIIKAFEKLSLEDKEFAKTEKFNSVIKNNPMLHLALIDFNNNGEISFEQYEKSDIIYNNEEKIAKHFFKKGYDLKTYFKSVINSADLLGKEHDLQAILGALLSFGIEEDQYYSKSSTELTEFKRDIIEEIVYGEMGVYINTAANEEEYSWKDIISKIENFEYYNTETGTFLVNPGTGAILGVEKNGEMVNIEDVKLQEENSQEKNPNAIKYTFEDKQSQIFLAEKDKEGKYVLKGYMQDEKGNNIEIDVGLARNFLDDTTEIERQLISQTSEVRSGNVKEVAEQIKSDIIRSEEAEKGTVEKKEEEHEGR